MLARVRRQRSRVEDGVRRPGHTARCVERADGEIRLEERVVPREVRAALSGVEVVVAVVEPVRAEEILAKVVRDQELAAESEQVVLLRAIVTPQALLDDAFDSLEKLPDKYL